MKPPEFNPHTYVASFGKVSVAAIVDAIIVDGRKEVIRSLLEYGVQKVIDENRARKRKLAKLPMPVSPKASPRPIRLSPRTMKKAATDLHGALLDWKIRGVSLGLITKAELIAEADADERKGKGYLDNVAFYRALAQKMKAPADKVADVWSEEQVEKLKASIWNDRAA